MVLQRRPPAWVCGSVSGRAASPDSMNHLERAPARRPVYEISIIPYARFCPPMPPRLHTAVRFENQRAFRYISPRGLTCRFSNTNAAIAEHILKKSSHRTQRRSPVSSVRAGAWNSFFRLLLSPAGATILFPLKPDRAPAERRAAACAASKPIPLSRQGPEMRQVLAGHHWRLESGATVRIALPPSG